MHNLLAAIVCFIFATILFFSLDYGIDAEMQHQDIKLEKHLSKADRERVIANLRGNYENH